MARGIATWDTALQIADVFAVDPLGCGGIWLQARSGPVRDAYMDLIRQRIGDDVVWRRLPAGLTDDRLLGGLDLTATLLRGQPVFERGLLSELNGGVCVLPMAERTDLGLAARLAAVMDAGAVLVERDGFALRDETRFGVIALDEATDEDDAGLPAKLSDRLAFCVDLSAVPYACVRAAVAENDDGTELLRSSRIVTARALLPDVCVPDALLEGLCEAAAGLGVAGLRPIQLAMAVTRVVAALEGRTQAEVADAALAGQWVFGPRATQIPQAAQPDDETAEQPEPEPDPPPPESPEPEQPEPDQADTEKDDENEETRQVPDALPEDMLLDIIQASLPDGLLAKLTAQMASRNATKTSGPAGMRSASQQHGRPKGTAPGQLGPGARLSLVATLRAAAPWQKLRRAQAQAKAQARSGGVSHRAGPVTAAGGDNGQRVFVEQSDFRIKRFENRSESVTIFAVDASGSAAAQRLGEAKGAVELLLAECYVRRDHVALVALRGEKADVLLPPTRSLVRAKRALVGLPGGGGTPLADGVMAALGLALAAKRRGQTPALVFLTDGRGNVARDGSKGREAGQADALAAAKILRAEGFRTIVIDTSRRPQSHAANLAQAMDALYLPLPNADALRLSSAIGGFVNGTRTS
ncbi:MAG: magnesium chelatase subunit D [Pseudomonadota bacterium]